MSSSFLHKFSRYCLYLFVFCLPLQTHYLLRAGSLNGTSWEFGHIMLYAFDLILIITVITWQIAQHLGQSELGKFYRGLRWLVVILLIVPLLTLNQAGDQALLLSALARLLLATALFKLVANSPGIRLNIAKILIASLVIQALWGTVQFFSQASFDNKWLGVSEKVITQPGTSVIESASSRILRAYGGLTHPNVLGGFLAVGLIFAFGLIARRQALTDYFQSKQAVSWSYVAWHLALVVLSAGIFFSFSRSAIIAGSAGLAIIIIYNYRRLLGLLVPLGLIMITVISLYLPYQSLYQGRVLAQGRLENISLDERSSYLADAEQLIREAPVLGHGLANYGLTVFLRQLQAEADVYYFQPVHNTWLLITSEIGLIATLALILLLLLILARSSRAQFSASFAPINCALIITLVILMSFDHYFWTQASAIYLFWLILGFIVNSAQAENNTETGVTIL